MSEWTPKRFWTEVSVIKEAGGFAVGLDGRKVKTPAKAPLIVPTAAMAEAIVVEWQAQGESVNPTTMPCTRSANAAIDKVQHQHAEVADMLADYGDSDLLCYRADTPDELVRRQALEWDPALDWAKTALGVELKARTGVLHVPQASEQVAILRDKVHALSAFQLAAFHDLVGMSGSLVLGFAAALNWRPVEDIWTLSRLDELWQAEQWGVDEEAEELAERKRQDFLHAKRFYDWS